MNKDFEKFTHQILGAVFKHALPDDIMPMDVLCHGHVNQGMWLVLRHPVHLRILIGWDSQKGSKKLGI